MANTPKQKDDAHMQRLLGRQNVTTKHFEIIRVFDDAFRRQLNDEGNRWQDIQRFLLQRMEEDNRRYPCSRGQIFEYKYFFENTLGAKFKAGRNNRSTIFNYEDRNCVLKELQKLVGTNKKDGGQTLLDILEESRDNSALAVWTRIFLRKMLNEGESELDVLSFYENLHAKGLEHFETLLKHILNKQPIKLFYKPRNKKEQLANGDNVTMHEAKKYVKCVHPYFLKNYNMRWYLVCRSLDKILKNKNIYKDDYQFIALDCIDDLKWSNGDIKVPAITLWHGEPFIECDEDFADFFSDMIGVTLSPEGPQEVILRFSKQRFDYVATKPMAGTQKILPQGHKFYDSTHPTISLYVHITKELVQQVLSFGDDIEVIAPESLRQEIAAKIHKMAKKYEKPTSQLADP
ncbi:MAG: WYL domain-containing protein [Muribaculaceae bacterium]|nr:WYL domain-containing protein [Muribaculaceae bacterium]